MRQHDNLNLYNHIILNEGAYFYKKGTLEIDNRMIDTVFNTVLEGADGYKLLTVVKRKEETNGLEYAEKAFCSLLIFKANAPSSNFDFEKDIFPNELKEDKIAYLLIVEISDYVILVKKNISRLTSFVNQLQSIDSKTLGGILIAENTCFQQMKLTGMNMNENAMRNKAYEANDLENSMPTFGANQNIVTTARFTSGKEICTLNVSTSRLSKFGSKKGIYALLGWMDMVVSKIDQYVPTNNFLNRFAEPVSWKNMKGVIHPNSLLVNIFEIENYIEKCNDSQIYRKYGEDDYRDRTDLFKRIIKNGVKCYELTNAAPDVYQCIGIGSGNGVKASKLGIKVVASDALSSLYYNNNVDYIRIVDLINQLSCFSVGFDDYCYIFNSRRLYKNGQIDNDLDSILSIFEPYSEIGNVTSEKGKNYNYNSNDFQADSMFHVVETYLFPNADNLVCDDFGNEWADHLTIQSHTVSFIHSKCKGEKSLSASNFQDVIGQALKNLGHLMPKDEELDGKQEIWKGNWGQTSIRRCRKGSVDGFIHSFKSLRSNPNLTKEVCLAIDFISKKQLGDAFQKLKNNQPLQQKNNVIQMVWLLNGFISACKDLDMHCRIFCAI